MNPRERIIRITLLLLANPNAYTIKQIAEKIDITPRNVKDDITVLKRLRIRCECRRPGYTYSIVPDKEFKELGYLSPLTNEDRVRITSALRTYSSKENLYLNKKLDSLYDFQQLGLRALRKPALEKIDRLKAAKDKKVCVILENYYSNTSDPRDRKVEPFSIDADLDTLQAYDVESLQTKHFRLSRIDRVSITKDVWQHQSGHHKKETDVFRIANDNRVMIHLELDMQGYNVLVDTFPKAKEKIEKGAEKNTFNFQSEVNANFFGVTNFILGNADNIQVISPESLKDHLRKQARKIIEKYTF